MSNPVEPQGPGARAGDPVGDIGSEDLAGRLTSDDAGDDRQGDDGHFRTHFDEPSLDFSDPVTAIDARVLDELRVLAARYPQPRSALLPMLHLVQSVEGRVSPAGIETCAEILGLSTAEVSGVATFYTMYKRRPVGRYHVGVCTTALCAILGGDEVFARLQEHLGIGHDETTGDGAITLEHLECNAACDYAPVMMVNWEFFDNTTPDLAVRVVDALRAGEPVQATRGARVATWRETERVLAGFPDNRADEGPTSGPASQLGLRIAREHGWSAPPPPAPEQPDDDDQQESR